MAVPVIRVDTVSPHARAPRSLYSIQHADWRPPHAAASAFLGDGSAFFAVSFFLVGAFFVAAFLVLAVEVPFDTRPDLVLLRATGFLSSTAGA